MQTLTDLLQEFQKRGDKPSVAYRTGVRRLIYNYRRLYDLSLRMNSVLASSGIEKGDRVVIWGPNGPMWVVAFWGCVARGATIVPVDFMSGKARAETIAGMTEAKLVIQSRLKPERITERQSVILEELEDILEETEPLSVLSSTAPGETAQIIYTSGTTGSPKGVVLTHRNLVTNLKQVNEHIPVVTDDYVFLSLLPLSHMFEQMGGFLTTLYRGATIVYLRTLKPSAIMEGLGEEDIYAVIAVPRLLQLLKKGIEREMAAKHLTFLFESVRGLTSKLPFSLRKIIFLPVQRKFGRHFTFFVSGGAALDPDDFNFWSSLGFIVIEGYGLTECSPVLAANTMDSRIPGSVGKALPDVELRIDDNEITAKGENVFPRYYRNENATKEAFTTDGWFKTGDMGNFDADGNLFIKGRSKELIVTGAGINVYPDEIEAIINRIPGVKEACVIGIDRGSGEEVHAVLIPDGSGRRPEEIINEANSRLDDLHQITGYSVWPEPDFPKTTTMKVRKFQVKEALAKKEQPTASAVPTDPLVSIIARVTGSPVGQIHEGSALITDLGLTSIGRLELVNYLEQEYRLDLEETAIDRKSTVADVRKLVTSREKTETPNRLRFWTNKPFFHYLRVLGDLLVTYPVLRRFMPLKVTGVEILKKVEPPVLFIANHLSYLDYVPIMFALPKKWRYHTATAAWEEFFFPEKASLLKRIWKRFTYEYGTILLNLFPLPQTGGVRRTLRYMGRLADTGHNILLFPEGERSPDGRLLPFKPGLGLMAKELRIPVVPIRLSGIERVMPRGQGWPKRGRVEVVFGDPIFFKRESPEQIVEISRNAVQALGAG